MGLEAAVNYAMDLNPLWPLGTDDKSFGDDHLRYIKTAMQSLAQCHPGGTAPTTTWPFQLWADTTNGLMMIRNSADTAWVVAWELDLTDLGFQKKLVTVRNNTGATLTRGSVVRITGSIGTALTVALADYSSEATSANTFGVVDADILNNADGPVFTLGLMENLDTSGLTEGATVWLSASGAMTTTAPTTPNHLVQVGWCVRSHVSLGQIFIHPDNGREFGELHDVLFSGLANGDITQYDSALGYWKNVPFNPPTLFKATQTGAYTTVAGDKGYLIPCTGSWTLTLLAAATAGNGYNVFVQNRGQGIITVTDGTFSYAVSPNETLHVGTDGSAYYAIDNFLQPVDLSAFTTADCKLQVGQEGYVNFSAATSIPLNVASGDGEEYELDVFINWNGMTLGAVTPWLDPNNTTYASAFSVSQFYGGSSGSVTAGVTTQSSIPLCAVTAGPIYGARAIINTSTLSKQAMVRFRGSKAATTYFGELHALWSDFTTVWSSLGTLTLPYAVTGVARIRRLA